MTDVLKQNDPEQRERTERVTADREQEVEEIELDPGERVVGSGTEIGRVYRLEDGRTVIVRERGKR